ncbi:PIN domain-containing protein [Rhizobium tumorigenes]|uniref:PIN domain-containing protein n=1 Tax=Rhizobium tumorigenes TaxID=2041385 RepID=UPI00241F27C5|nr:PIN domain-containing protein [Rhizobium tumorigenes]WFS04646.1 PIN domain-containing protein [Rhizobium tumorigenes]
MYLLDTNIISLVAPGRQRGIAEVRIAEWLVRVSDQLHLSVVTTSEIESGIAQLNRAGATARASALAAWLDEIVQLYAIRIHPLDIQTARLAGQLYDRAVGNGHKPLFEDAAIAATAHIRNFTVITRNAVHFSHFSIPLINPYDGMP